MIAHKPVYEFNSIFAPAMYAYLNVKESLGEKIIFPGNLLRQFDRYCMSIDLSELKLTQELAENWFLTKAGEKASTRGSRVSALWGFAKYLSSIGTEVTWRPISGYTGRQKRYVPYIYTTDEIKNIFRAADTMPETWGKSRFNVIFPAVLRVLYGCGLRISEALALKIKDVDLKEGFIFVRDGKFGKNRKNPLSDSLLQYLKRYPECQESYQQ